MPAKVHMTVPRTFRRMAPPPRALVLHRGDLTPPDIEMIEGVPVTTPLRTILDLLGEGRISEDVLVEALREALDRGTITHQAIRETSLPEELGRALRELVARAA
jgi:hypothetical protein